MKANELMFKDWVRFGKKNWRCYNICGHTNEVLLENGVFTNVMNLSPIPLTAEILEKNGLKYDGTCYWLTRNEQVDIKVCPLQPDNEWWSELNTGFELSSKKADVTIDGVRNIYVHELQHALRLCEIDKEIVL